MIDQQTLLYKKDWDILIILDACRFDSFSKVVKQTNIKGELIPVNSHVVMTQKWYERNWNTYNDNIILITSHPYPLERGYYKQFHKFYNLFNDKEKWKSTEICFKKLVEIQNNYNKKFIVHIMPPHLPYLGKEGIKFMKELGIGLTGRPTMYRHVNEWAKKHGFKQLKKYYEENILYALKIIEKYLPNIKGRVVISGDHGELIGELDVYYHHHKHEKIFTVPWFKIQ